MSYLGRLVKLWRGEPREPRVTYAPEATPADGEASTQPAAQPQQLSEWQVSAELQIQHEQDLAEAQQRAEVDDVTVAMALSRSLAEQEQRRSLEQEELDAAIATGLPVAVASEASADAMSFKYWKNGSLDPQDQLKDGFYDVNGEFPELGGGDVFPDLAFLRQFEPEIADSREVIIVNSETDPGLQEIERLATEAFFSACASGVVHGAQAVARVVANHMGGPAHDDAELRDAWASSVSQLKWERDPTGPGGLLVPLGAINPGLSRHRAVLYKFLADLLCIPCCLLRQRSNSFCDSFQAMVIIMDQGEELLMDLMRQPGRVTTPEEHYKAEASSSSSSAQDPHASPWRLPQPQAQLTIGSGPGALPARRSSSKRHGALPALGSGNSGGSSSGAPEAAPQSPWRKARGGGNIGMGQQRGGHRRGASSPAAASPARSTGGGNGSDQDALSNASAGEHEGPVEFSHADLLSISTGSRGPGPMSPGQQQRQARPYAMGAGGRPQEIHHSYSFPTVATDPHLLAVAYQHNRQESHDLIDLRSPGDAAAASPSPPFRPQHPHHHGHSQSLGTTQQQLSQPSVRPLSPLHNRSPNRGQPSAGAPQLHHSMSSPVPRQFHHQEEEEEGHEGLPEDNYHGDETSGSGTDTDDDDLQENVTAGTRVWEPITDCLIDTAELIMQQRLGIGSYGEVHKAEWQGTEVAIKQFLEQSMTDAVQDEFLQEVRIMKELRHPNIVQFMGATWKPRGIVMQYMHRGSLFRLLHRNPKGKRLHLHRRLRMALDVALGMRYLHSRKPMIVHRDLKSPNLLVARDWTVRLCDFGLSKLKSNTFLSTKSSGGTPEWMAPEVLRNDPANEKSDIYSFAVIMWELMFYMEPWQGTRPMQVVYLVGNNNQRLPLPEETPLNQLIQDCWAGNPEERPSFDEIYERLKGLQRPINSNFEEDAPAPSPSQGSAS